MSICRLTEDQIKPASKVYSRAFQDDPGFIYSIPDSFERENKLHYLYEFVIRYGFSYGEVYATSPNLEGVATWLPYWESETSLERQNRCGLREIPSKMGIEFVIKFMPIENYYSSLHKRHANFPHTYLYSVAVDPFYQGKGFASILLRAKFAEIDKQKLPCYLETFTEKDASIYQHFGFEVIEEGIIPGTKVPIWAMLRKIE